MTISRARSNGDSLKRNGIRQRGKAVRGSALLYLVFLLFFVFPVIFFLSKRAIQQNKLNLKDWQGKSASGLAMNAPFDYIRQFNSKPFIDHSDAAQFSRPEMFYSVGFTKVDFVPNASDHSLYIRATGKYGRDAGQPVTLRTLETVIKFSNDMMLYSRVFRIPHGFGPGVVITIKGGYYARGLWIAPTAVPTFDGGPVVIDGDVDVQGAARFNGDVYFSDTTPNWGPAVFGPGVNRYPYVQNIQFPPNDPSFYITYNNHLVSNSSQTWTFGYEMATSRPYFDVAEEGGARHYYPEAGAILVADNSSLVINGTLHGRVAVICTGDGATAYAPAIPTAVEANVRRTGYVVFRSSFQYCHGQLDRADPTHAFMVLASRRVVFVQVPGGPINFSGAIHSWNMVDQGIHCDVERGLNISGTASASVLGVSYAASPIPLIQYSMDPGLSRNPPPGLPETPRVVMLKPKI